jgi:hypothetical protein
MISRVSRLVCLLCAVCLLSCGTTRYKGAAVLAGTGALLAGGGAVVFSVGDRPDENGRETSHVAQQIGLTTLVIGLGAIFAGGIWAAQVAHCDSDADCQESESCQKLFTTAGPWGHCVAR